MSSLGTKLRTARLEQGLDIATLSARTKINERFLEAIEADRRDHMPAGFFFRNWAVQYARALSLDEREIQEAVDRVLREEAPLPLPGQLQPGLKSGHLLTVKFHRRDSSLRLFLSFALLLVVVMGCSGFYAWWHEQQEVKRTKAAAAPPSIVNTKAAEPPLKASVAEAEEPTAKASVPEAKPALSVSEALLVQLHAREQTWLAIAPDGKQTFSGVLAANEDKTFEARESARINISNAGGVDVRFNGKPVGAIGPRGKPRVLLLNANGVRILDQGVRHKKARRWQRS